MRMLSRTLANGNCKNERGQSEEGWAWKEVVQNKIKNQIIKKLKLKKLGGNTKINIKNIVWVSLV